MKNKKTISVIAVVAVVFAIAFGVFFFYRKYPNAFETYAVIQKASKTYKAGNYPESFLASAYLLDSLKFSTPEVSLNLAHAGYLSAKLDSAKGLFDIDSTAMQDTAAVSNQLKFIQKSLSSYMELSKIDSNNYVASVANNQLGVIAIKNMNDLANTDEVLADAVKAFKAALQKDPENEIARYNYEMAKKKLELPNMVMAQIKSLIEKQKYREALALLTDAMEKDARVKAKLSDFRQRLENIVKIDSRSI